MFMNDERETKELELGASNTEPQVSNENIDKKEQENRETKPAGSGNNSFYERKETKQGSSAVWYKDWRGKTLGLSLAALILIGAGIPAGMAAAGYFNVQDDNYNTAAKVDGYKTIKSELERAYDRGIIAHYEEMKNEGWYPSNQYENSKKEAEKNASNTIDDEKKSLKDSYGNTWEEEWDKSLQEKGFHTSGNGGEAEYKESLISSAYENNVRSIYTKKSNTLEKVGMNDTKDYIYASTAYTNNPENDNYQVVRNNNKNEDYDSYPYTPQDLMTIYLYAYQPIVFNNSLLPFSPVVGSNTEADIEGNNITMTNAQVKNAWALSTKVKEGKDYGTDNFGGVQSMNSITFSGQSLGEEADIAVLSKMSGNALGNSGTEISAIVDTAFSDAKLTTISSSSIDYMDEDQVKLFTDSLEASLSGKQLLNKVDATGTASSKRLYGVEGLIPDTISFVSTNGLNNIGVEIYGTALLLESLNEQAKDPNARDFDIWSSYTNWVTSSFKYITILDYFTDLKDDTNKSWFTYDNSQKVTGVNLEANDKLNEFIDEVNNKNEDLKGITKNDLKNVLISDISLDNLNSISTSYNEAKSFAKVHENYYVSFDDKADGVKNDIITFTTSTNLANFTENNFWTQINTKKQNEVILKGGDQ